MNRECRETFSGWLDVIGMVLVFVLCLPLAPLMVAEMAAKYVEG